MAVLDVSITDHIALVILNRPDARNALNPELIIALATAWDELGANDDVRVIVVTSSGGSTFCSGFDLGTTIPLMTGAREPADDAERTIAADLGLLGRATLRDVDPGRPLIAAVNGHAIAGGMELMLACDLRVVARGVRLGLSEVALGLIPAMGGTARLVRHLPRATAMEMLLTAQPAASDDLEGSGLINRLVPEDRVLDEAMTLARIIAQNAPLAARAAREVIRAADDLDEADALALEARRSGELATTEDAREGPRAFMEKRSPVFVGR